MDNILEERPLLTEEAGHAFQDHGKSEKFYHASRESPEAVVCRYQGYGRDVRLCQNHHHIEPGMQ